MVTALKERNEALSARGVHNYEDAIQTGDVGEGTVLGRLLLLKFHGKQQLPMTTLRDVFLGAGLSEHDLPAPRNPADAWRLATKQLDGSEIVSETGTLKVLVRDWSGSKDPRRDITLESQETDRDRLAYASPACVITFEKKSSQLAWDNRLNPYSQGDAYRALEDRMEQVQRCFEAYKTYVDGEAIYRALRRKVIDPTAPLPMGQGAWLIWSEHTHVVHAVSSVVAALNDFNDEDAQSTANIFTVVNTPQDRETLSQSLDAAVVKEVTEGLDRIGRLLKNPEHLVNSQAAIEQEHYDGLLQMLASYQARLKKDTRDIETNLGLFEGMIADLQSAVSKNEARKRAEARRGR
jgi:hypothetical protein